MQAKCLSLSMKNKNLTYLQLIWKKVFDLDPCSYNLTLVTSNVNTNFSNITTSSCEDKTTKFETIRRKFVGNVHDLDQITVDGIYELEIKK